VAPAELVADGVPVSIPLLESALLVAEGVPVLLDEVPPEELLPIPANEKACHGTRTWFAEADEPVLIVAAGVPVPISLLAPAELVADGVPVSVPLLEPALLVADGVPVLLTDVPLDELLLAPLLVKLTTT
jgi:hypothetical protein